jgi:hypothetical protein
MELVRGSAETLSSGAASTVVPRQSAFTRQVMQLLDRTEYRICDQGEDLEAIYRLRYKSYVLRGVIDPNGEQLQHDSLDEVPNCRNYGIYIDGELVSTIRLHLVDAKNRKAPSMTAFGDLLEQRLDAGEVFVDPSRFATDPESPYASKLLPYVALRIPVSACVHFAVHYCLTTVLVNHAGFYKKVFWAENLAEPRSYPGCNIPVSLYQVEASEIKNRLMVRFPYFRSTPLERQLLFERPTIGARAPLTVVPTASRVENVA